MVLSTARGAGLAAQGPMTASHITDAWYKEALGGAPEFSRELSLARDEARRQKLVFTLHRDGAVHLLHGDEHPSTEFTDVMAAGDGAAGSDRDDDVAADA